MIEKHHPNTAHTSGVDTNNNNIIFTNTCTPDFSGSKPKDSKAPPPTTSFLTITSLSNTLPVNISHYHTNGNHNQNTSVDNKNSNNSQVVALIHTNNNSKPSGLNNNHINNSGQKINTFLSNNNPINNSNGQNIAFLQSQTTASKCVTSQHQQVHITKLNNNNNTTRLATTISKKINVLLDCLFLVLHDLFVVDYKFIKKI